MSGVTLTLMRLDEELKELIDLEAVCMGLTQFGS
jgi:dihydroxyacetone kinase-like protein